MTKTHGKILVKIIACSLKKSRRAHLLVTDRKIGRWQESKGDREEVTVSFSPRWGEGCDVVRSSRSFPSFLEKAAGFTNFAVKN
jgi:hypothetical protein